MIPGAGAPPGGRVLRLDGDVLTLLATGGAVREVTGASGPPIRPGDLVRLEPDGRAVRWVLVHRPPDEDVMAGGDGKRFGAPSRWRRLEARARYLAETRAFFREAGFLEVETPLVVPSPGTEVHLEATAVRQRPAPGAEPADRWLITSPEYAMKRLLAGGAGPIFQLGKAFRDGERGRHHRPEFTLLEWYRPWAGYEALMTDCEALIGRLAGAQQLTWQGQVVDLAPPWPRLPFLEAQRTLGGVVEPERLTPDEQLAAHVERVEPRLGRGRPTFLTDWPVAMASLARPRDDDPSVAERVELFVAGLELANGFGELTDAAEQRRRCEAELAERAAHGLPLHPLDEAFLAALEAGMPPSAGIALGFDRLVMLLADAADIDEVVAF